MRGELTCPYTKTRRSRAQSRLAGISWSRQFWVDCTIDMGGFEFSGKDSLRGGQSSAPPACLARTPGTRKYSRQFGMIWKISVYIMVVSSVRRNTLSQTQGMECGDGAKIWSRLRCGG